MRMRGEFERYASEHYWLQEISRERTHAEIDEFDPDEYVEPEMQLAWEVWSHQQSRLDRLTEMSNRFLNDGIALTEQRDELRLEVASLKHLLTRCLGAVYVDDNCDLLKAIEEALAK